MGATAATSGRGRARREMGGGAVLSVEQAVALLPFSDVFARRWLKAERLVSRITMGGEVHECVVWAAVQERLWPEGAISNGPGLELAPAPATGGSLPREKTRRRV